MFFLPSHPCSPSCFLGPRTSLHSRSRSLSLVHVPTLCLFLTQYIIMFSNTVHSSGVFSVAQAIQPLATRTRFFWRGNASLAYHSCPSQCIRFWSYWFRFSIPDQRTTFTKFKNRVQSSFEGRFYKTESTALLTWITANFRIFFGVTPN